MHNDTKYTGEERRKKVEVEAQVLQDIKLSLHDIQKTLKNDEGTGLCQRQKIIWLTLFGNGKVGLCERFRFLNWKVTFFGGVGAGVFFLVRELFIKYLEKQ
jgi:hypothetical protein